MRNTVPKTGSSRGGHTRHLLPLHWYTTPEQQNVRITSIYIHTTEQHFACLVGAPARRHHSEALETPSGWWHVHQKQTRRRNEIDMLPLSIVTMTENSHGQKGQPVTREGPRQTEAVSDLLACTAPGTRYFCRLRFSLFSFFSLRRMGKNKA